MTEEGYTVHMLIYSGRPDSEWQLTKAEDDEFRGLVTGLPLTHRRVEVPYLGYQGFLIMESEDDSNYEISSKGKDSDFFHVYNGLVESHIDGHVKYYKDEKGLEEWLLQKTEEKGYGDMDRVRRQMKEEEE